MARKKVVLGSKPHLLFGTMIGTLAAYYLFLRHYKTIKEDGEVWVWFGIRSDGRCGRDFLSEWSTAETSCGRGQCCSSHGWCGHGEEYCSVALGCQSDCWPATKEDEAKREEEDRYRHHHDAPDDDEYAERMHHYKYDEDGDYGHHDYHRERYRHHDPYHDYNHEYHHRYDSGDHDEMGMGHGHGHGSDHHDEYGGGHHYGDDSEHDDEEHEEHGGHDGSVDEPPELVGLEEKHHLGTGDGVPLHGEQPTAAA